ncbi:MAG: hypothetical protein HXY18_15925, partial [Bryobacteraceae bacterium]|nr:hypothetical protein [Bryobacteraceae bacterium]
MHHPSRLAAALLAATTAVFLWLWFSERRKNEQIILGAAQNAAEQAKLKTEIAERVREIEALRAQMDSEGIVPALPARPPAPPDESKRLEAVRNLAQAEQRIAALQSSLNDARERGGQLEAQVERLQAENKRLES